MELAGVIRQQRYLDNIPLLFITSEKQRPRHLDAHDIGVDGFLIKPVPADVLAMTVMARARRHRRLAGHITTDGLTGLLNHSQLLSQLDMELVRTRRQQEVLSFVQLNIDHFKDINDTHGHPIGDQVLRTLARILRERLRRSDIIGRLGGDEFGVIMPATEPGQAKVLIEELAAAFHRVAHSANTATFWLSFRAGVAFTRDGGESRTLLAEAAAAVQQAKAQGGGVVVADSVSPAA
jgi:diguanylate cyclase (GGDEF)-like protein